MTQGAFTSVATIPAFPGARCSPTHVKPQSREVTATSGPGHIPESLPLPISLMFGEEEGEKERMEGRKAR